MVSPRSGGNVGGISIGGTAFLVVDNRALQTLGRDMLGRIGKAPTQVRAAHFEMARKAGDTIAFTLQQRVRATGRTQRPTQTLILLLRDDRALDASIDGWVVGRAGFFESSKAGPYYRNLETGTRIFVGRELRGFFQSASGQASPPSGERFRKDPRLIQVNKFFAGTKSSREELKKQAQDGRFSPGLQKFGRTQRRLKEPKQDDKGRTPGGFKIIIRNPIPAYYYFRDGGNRFMRSGQVGKIYDRHLGGLPGYVPSR